MGASPMSLKKNRCSMHLSPMLRRAGSRSSSLAKRPGSSGYWVLQYSSSDAYTFSLSISTSCMLDSAFASETCTHAVSSRQPVTSGYTVGTLTVHHGDSCRLSGQSEIERNKLQRQRTNAIQFFTSTETGVMNSEHSRYHVL